MALWNRSQIATNIAKPKEIQKWDFAKEVTKAEAQSDDLPLGWYYYQDGYIWYGLKPDENNEKLIRSYSQRTPQELVDWLGVPLQRTEESIPEERRKENGFSGALNSEDILQRKEIEGPDSFQAFDSKQEVQEKKSSRRKKSGRARPNDVHFWLSNEELKSFRRRVQRAGLTQSDFLRRAALSGRIIIEERGADSVALLDELELLRAEIGRQGGLLKMVVKPNMGQRELAPEEWQELVQAIRRIEHLTKKLSEIQERL